jgi:hypothetical protein
MKMVELAGHDLGQLLRQHDPRRARVAGPRLNERLRLLEDRARVLRMAMTGRGADLT